MKKYLLHRQIDFFDKHSEKLMGEIDLKYFDLEKIKTKIDFDVNDPLLYYSYPIDSGISDIFPEIKFDFTRFDYFLSCFSNYSVRTNNTMDNYLNKIVRIIVSFSETIKTNDEIDTFGSCTVRFYKIRQSCETKMNVENLNDYKTDAILEFEKR